MSKKKKISKILICSLSVISIIAMLTLSAFAAAPSGFTDSGESDSLTDSDWRIYVYADSVSFNGTTYNRNSNVNYFTIRYDTITGGSTSLTATSSSIIIFDCSSNVNNVVWENLDNGAVRNYSINNNEYFTINTSSITFHIGINAPSPEPLEKTFAIQFYNNDTYYSSIKVSGMSNDETTFSSISSIKYGNTEVYSNGSWVSGYSSTIQYTSETPPDITTLNSDLGGIVTFSTQYREPNFWDGVMAAVSSLMTNIGTTANAIVQNEYLSIFCLVLPLLSLAVGLLVRMKNNG